MKDLVKGNIVYDTVAIQGIQDRRSPIYLRKILENDLILKTVKMEDQFGNATTVASDFISHLVRIPEELLLNFGFIKYEDEEGVYFKDSVRLKKQPVIDYQVSYPGISPQKISCLYELQNFYNQYTCKDLDITDFNNWQFDFNL